MVNPLESMLVTQFPKQTFTLKLDNTGQECTKNNESWPRVFNLKINESETENNETGSLSRNFQCLKTYIATKKAILQTMMNLHREG